MSDSIYIGNPNLPRHNLWFLKEISKKLDDLSWDRTNGKNQILVTISQDFEYCFESVTLLENIMSDSKWEFKLKRYSKEKHHFAVTKEDVDWFIYTWTMTKKTV